MENKSERLGLNLTFLASSSVCCVRKMQKNRKYLLSEMKPQFHRPLVGYIWVFLLTLISGWLKTK